MADPKLELILAAKDLASKEVNKLHGALLKLHGAAGKVGGGFKAVGSGIANIGKLAGLAALGGVALLTSQILLGSKALKDQAKIDAQTGAVIKSTGGAAKVTAGHVNDLANAIKDYSGVDDDAVKSGENMLLTFTNIRNGVGKNNQIFDQATKTLTDMSVAMGTDMSKQAIQLGKALNDPIKGISALSKVGVTFTDVQKKQIATMVKSGDTMGAQKVILAELNREFGGSAKAVGDSAEGAWNKFGNAVQDLQKQLASYFLPVIVTVLGFLTKTVIPGIGIVVDRIGAWVKANQPLIHQIGSFVSGAMTALAHIVGVVAGAIGGGGKGGGKSLISTVVDMAKTVISYVVPKVRALFKTLGDIASSVGKVVGPIISALLPAFGAVVKALFGGGGGGGRNGRGGGGKKGGGGLVGAIGDLIGVLWGDGNGALGMVVKFAGAAFKVLLDALAQVIDKVASLIGWVKQAIDWLGKLNLITDHTSAQADAYHRNGTLPGKGNAGGGYMYPGETYDIAERRGERVTMGRNGTAWVQSSVPRRVGGESPSVIHTHVYLDKRQIAEAVDEYLFRSLRRAAPTGGRV